MADTETRNFLPDIRELITIEFLRSATGQPNIRRFSVGDGTELGDNFMSVLYSLSVEVACENEDIQTLYFLVKCYPCHPSRQKHLTNGNLFHNELSFYTILVPDLLSFQTTNTKLHTSSTIKLACPPCVGGKAINFFECDEQAKLKTYSPLDNFIMMVDMRKSYGFKMTNCKKGLDVDHVKLAFIELATLHAVSWAYQKKNSGINLTNKYAFLKKSRKTGKTQMWLNILHDNVEIATAALDSKLGQGNALTRAISAFEEKAEMIIEHFSDQDEATERSLREDLLRNPANTSYADFEPWRVVCHGDIWSNNMLFQYDQETGKPQRVVLVDFPLAKLGCPTLDLACLIYISTRQAFRRNYLEESLQVYHDRFIEVCKKIGTETLPAFCLKELKERFHVSKLVGFLIAVISLPLNLVEAGSEVDFEKVDSTATMEDMMKKACKSGVEGSLYQEWILELVQDLHDDGAL